jgi:uncharacterized CHY-type Zn-finger protein
MNKQERIELGFIDIPVRYQKFTRKQKNVLCDKIIDTLLQHIETQIDDNEISKMTLLDSVFESTILTNEEYENYEVCQVILDCRKRLNDN